MRRIRTCVQKDESKLYLKEGIIWNKKWKQPKNRDANE